MVIRRKVNRVVIVLTAIAVAVHGEGEWEHFSQPTLRTECRYERAAIIL